VNLIAILVLNKRNAGSRGEYVGRPSTLGNPFKLECESDRDAVIARYEVWLRKRIAARDQLVCNELNRLYIIARDTGLLELVCWCAPKRCHAEVIRKVLLEALQRNSFDCSKGQKGIGNEHHKNRSATHQSSAP
jgi:Domain of unknown function (DUF4326)